MNYDKLFICTTDTVTGIGGPICSETLELIYKLKKRPKSKKIMILVCSIKQAQNFRQWNDEAEKIAQKFWPGAYSIIVNNQGFRMPANQKLLKFLEKNGPMYVTSANISGQKPIDIKDASKFFPKVKNVYDFGYGSGQASQIYNVDTKQWIR